MKREKQPRRGANSHLEQDICIHIFTVSSAMVGVCLTVIGLIRVVITLGKADTVADDLLASDALLFLTSCLLSYAALRARSFRRMHRIERAAVSDQRRLLGDLHGLVVQVRADDVQHPARDVHADIVASGYLVTMVQLVFGTCRR